MCKLELDRYIGWLILLANIGLSQIYEYWCTCSPITTDIKTVFKGKKNAGICDLKSCNYVVCPAEGGPLFIN